jgi:hypothetical protein
MSFYKDLVHSVTSNLEFRENVDVLIYVMEKMYIDKSSLRDNRERAINPIETHYDRNRIAEELQYLSSVDL